MMSSNRISSIIMIGLVGGEISYPLYLVLVPENQWWPGSRGAYCRSRSCPPFSSFLQAPHFPPHCSPATPPRPFSIPPPQPSCIPCLARSNAVLPSLSFDSTSAPASFTKNLTVSRWPFTAARLSGVHPYLFFDSTLALAS